VGFFLPKYKLRATVFPNAKLAGPAQQNAKGVERAVEGFCTEAEIGWIFLFESIVTIEKAQFGKINASKRQHFY
jgi:hypothetical protein